MSSRVRVHEALTALRSLFGPDASVEHRANHTGAGKLMFAVEHGPERLWVKVAGDHRERDDLLRWASVSGLLERHGAPTLLDVLDLAGSPALVLAHVEAPAATRTAVRERYGEVSALLAGLHADAELAALLGPPTTTAGSFTAVWVERFVADLEIIEGFVARDVHAYLLAEVDLLAGLVAALDHPVHAAVHGDPWHENLVLAPDRVWLLDWEDLAVGDPVVDEAIVLHDAYGTDPRHWPRTEKHTVALRALMLDAVVDVAADWVEATDPVVRSRKEAGHLAALEAYRASYG
jgi:aminoglycoside phosphotransferase (APT) family kinase protein